MIKNISRILLVRTDKIGDVILTTPAIAALREKFPEAHLVGLASSIGYDVYASNPHLTKVLKIDANRHGGFFGVFRLASDLRKEKIEAAVVFQCKFKVALAIWLARVRYRMGPLSKWWSWIFFNLGRRQNRSAVEMHEADYNLQLLKAFGITVADTWQKTYLTVSAEAKKTAQEFIQEKGINPKFKTIAVHPGMAGSALNWSERHYITLGRRLLKRYNIIVTGGPGEGTLVDRVVQGITRDHGYLPERPVAAKYIGENGLKEFIAILDRCDGIVAPSTGPMHIGVALGKKVVTVFSPIKVQSALRWGPYGVPFGTNLGISPNDQVSVLVPDVNCAEDFKCALSACIYHPCMPRISVEDIETQLLVLLEETSVSMFKSPNSVGTELEDGFEEQDL